MKVLSKGIAADGTEMQIEDWHGNYDFMPYGSTLAFYMESKATHKGSFAPKAGERYRFSFDFPNNEEAEQALNELAAGIKDFKDFLKYWSGKPEYINCI